MADTGSNPVGVTTDVNKRYALKEIVRDASKLAEKRAELERLRMDYAREWAQNRAFYNGHQWVWWNTFAGQIETLGVEDGEKPRYKVRLTANQMTPNTTQLVAQMTKTRPTIHAVPASASDRDVKAAQLAERLFEYWWHELHLKAKLQEALTHAQISQGYWLLTWDPYANKEFRVLFNPESGQPITDNDLEDAFRTELDAQAKQRGLDPQQVLSSVERTFYLGDIKVQTLAGEQVWVDPVATTFEDAAYVICRYPMDVDEVKARWGVDVAPDAVTEGPRPQLLWTKRNDSRSRTAREVYCGFFRPSPSLPKGRIVCWIENPNKILEESDWNLPFNDLPVVKFPGIQGLNTVYDMARASLARPLQKELNNKVSKIAEAMNLTMRPQMMAPIGSLSEQLTDEPGKIYQYAPVQNQIPQWRPIPALPAYVFEYVQDIQARIDRIYNLMPTERSQLPPRTDSGNLVDLMQEAVADQLSPEIQRMEIALARAGEIMAKYAQRYYIEPRFLKIRGPGGSIQVQKFLNTDLAGGFGFEAEAGSGLPRTRAGQIETIKELIQMQVLSPADAMPYLPIGGLRSIQQKLQADEEFAHRKIDKLIAGEPLNIPALQLAAGDIQQGWNPQTGMPFESSDEVDKYLQNAALQPVQFENWEKSLQVLREHMLAPEFENYDQDTQSRFLQHYNNLWQTVISMPNVQAPVKTTLSLRGTVGPTVGSQILRNSGIFTATPQTMAELPLETDVRDYLGQTPTHDTGNMPMQETMQGLAGVQAMGHAQDQHEVDQAKAMHQMSLAEQQNDRTQQQSQSDVAIRQHAHLEDQRRKEEVHQQALAHARKKHEQQLALMRQQAQSEPGEPTTNG